MPRKRRFIKSAIKRPGALSGKAKRAGKTTYAYALAHQHDKTQTGRQARFYLHVLRPAARKRRKK